MFCDFSLFKVMGNRFCPVFSCKILNFQELSFHCTKLGETIYSKFVKSPLQTVIWNKVLCRSQMIIMWFSALKRPNNSKWEKHLFTKSLFRSNCGEQKIRDRGKTPCEQRQNHFFWSKEKWIHNKSKPWSKNKVRDAVILANTSSSPCSRQ